MSGDKHSIKVGSEPTHERHEIEHIRVSVVGGKRKKYCAYCGTDADAAGYERAESGEIVCDECIMSMSESEYDEIVGSGGAE